MYSTHAGGKHGTVMATWSETNRDRRDRLRQVATETIDMNKDPYFMKNHIGSYECKLCLTLHNSEGSYLAHTQGKKHMVNLARRAAKENSSNSQTLAPEKPKVKTKKFVKIGRPGYKITKQKDPVTGQLSLLFQIDYPEIVDNVIPRHRFMSAYEQKIEPPNRQWQYILFAAEPYETIAFKIRSWEIDKSEKKFWTHWNGTTKNFFVQASFKNDKMAMRQMQGECQQQPEILYSLLSVPPPPPPNSLSEKPVVFFAPPPSINFIGGGIPLRSHNQNFI